MLDTFPLITSFQNSKSFPHKLQNYNKVDFCHILTSEIYMSNMFNNSQFLMLKSPIFDFCYVFQLNPESF